LTIVLINGEVIIEFASVSAHPNAIMSVKLIREKNFSANISIPYLAKTLTDQRKNIPQTIASVPATASVSQNASQFVSYHCLQIT
jgi:hypothetical protein